MRCPDRELLLALADGELETEERGAIERHLAECQSCAEYRDDLRKLNVLGKASLRTIPVPPSPSVVLFSPRTRSASEPRLLPLAAAFAVFLIAARLIAPPANDSAQQVTSPEGSGTSVTITGHGSPGDSPPSELDRTKSSGETVGRSLAPHSRRQVPLIALEEVPRVQSRTLRQVIPPTTVPNW
jgi:anti-sigma factor RsiW